MLLLSVAATASMQLANLGDETKLAGYAVAVSMPSLPAAKIRSRPALAGMTPQWEGDPACNSACTSTTTVIHPG